MDGSNKCKTFTQETAVCVQCGSEVRVYLTRTVNLPDEVTCATQVNSNIKLYNKQVHTTMFSKPDQVVLVTELN